MAIAGRRPDRDARRVPLARKGNPGKNSRRRPTERRTITLPWRGLGKIFSLSVFFAFLLFFIGGVSFCLMYSYRYITGCQYFSLKMLEIQGASRLSSREILETAGLLQGANTLELSISKVERALTANPWVADVSVQRVLPGGLAIILKEKKPAFWMLHEDGLHYADVEGGIIAPVSPGRFASLPALEVEKGAEESAKALPDLILTLRRARLPLDISALSWIRLSAARGVEIYVEDADLKISLGLDGWLSNVRRLETVMADLERRGEISRVRSIRAHGSNVWVERTAGPGTTG